MKLKMYLLALLCSITLIQTNAQSKQEKKVAQAVEQLKQAMIDGNREQLERLASDKLSYGHSGGAVEDKKAFVEKIASGHSDFVTITLSDQTITVSGKTALVRHTLYATTNDGGKPGEVKLKVLLVWQRTGGHWKLLARQAVKLTT